MKSRNLIFLFEENLVIILNISPTVSCCYMFLPFFSSGSRPLCFPARYSLGRKVSYGRSLVCTQWGVFTKLFCGIDFDLLNIFKVPDSTNAIFRKYSSQFEWYKTLVFLEVERELASPTAPTDVVEKFRRTL